MGRRCQSSRKSRPANGPEKMMKVDPIAAAEFAETRALCRPWTASYFFLEQRIETNGIFADIRHFGWEERVESRFEASSYYIDFSLGPRTTNALCLYPDRNFHATPGDIIFLPKGVSFPTRCDPGKHSLLCLTFENERARNLFDSEELEDDLAPCFDVRDVRIRRALARLTKEVRAPGFGQDILVESVAITLVVDLCRHLSTRAQVRAPRNGRIAGWRLRRLRERIDAGLSGPLSLADLAAECGMSARHLIRTFKMTTGITLTEFISEARIERAKRELMSDDLMIKVIAGNCGFHGAAAFSAAFRKATGLTPRQYREQRFRLAH
jgi:AraC family transcriptional regulator